MSDFRDQIAQLVEKYVSSPGKSFQQLAKRSGVGYSTVREFINGTRKTMTVHNALMLLNEITDNERTIELLKLEWPDFAEVLAQSYYNSRDAVNYKSLAHIKNDTMARIFWLTCTKDGVSRQQIEDELGHEGLRVLDEILESYGVNEVNGRYKFSNDVTYTDKQDLLEIGERCMSVLRSRSDDDIKGVLFNTETTDEIGQKLIQDAILNLSRAVFEASKRKGDRTFAITTGFGLISQGGQDA